MNAKKEKELLEKEAAEQVVQTDRDFASGEKSEDQEI